MPQRRGSGAVLRTGQEARADDGSSQSSKTSEVLRVGVLLDSLEIKAWQRRTLAEVAASRDSQVVLLIVNVGNPRRPSASPLARLWRGRRHLLYTLYSRLDRALCSVANDAFAAAELPRELGSPDILEVVPRRTRFSDYLEEDDLARIRDYELDVAIRFGFRILRGDVLSIARHGVWSYHHDDPRRIRGGPPCFWEVMEDHRTTGSMLQVLTENLDGGPVLLESFSPTHRRSVTRNRHHVYWKSAAFVPRALARLADARREGNDTLISRAAIPAPYSRRLYRKPTNLELLPTIGRWAGRSLSSWLAERLGQKQWFLAYSSTHEASPALYRMKPLYPPRDRSWADPFAWVEGDRTWIFFEELIHDAGRAHISVIELDRHGLVSGPTRVLERPYHLSHPFLFRYRGDLFMVPESAENRTLEIYRCERFPDRWQLEAVPFEDVRAVDATLFETDGLWWLFMNMASDEQTHCHDELFLYSSSHPLGGWQAHPSNPIVSDARRARPAGALFSSRSQLFRPGQDCSIRYGYGITINRVERLDRNEYLERPVGSITPNWRKGLLGTHTLNRAGSYTVVDGQHFWRRGHPVASARPTNS